jgi:hypothetical protein
MQSCSPLPHQSCSLEWHFESSSDCRKLHKQIPSLCACRQKQSMHSLLKIIGAFIGIHWATVDRWIGCMAIDHGLNPVMDWRHLTIDTRTCLAVTVHPNSPLQLITPYGVPHKDRTTTISNCTFPVTTELPFSSW